MNSERLSEIKARLNKTTQAPWIHNNLNISSVNPPQDLILATDKFGHQGEYEFRNEHAAIFIANARQDIEVLLAKVEFLLNEMDNAASFISIGENAKAHDRLCKAMGVDIHTYGLYSD